MNDIIEISTERSELGAKLFDEVAHVYPDGVTKGGNFLCKLSLEDTRVQRIMQVLEGAGWHPRLDVFRSRGSCEYSLRVWRSFSPEDWDAAALLHPKPHVILQHSHGHTPDGKNLVINRRELDRIRGIVGPNGWTFVVDAPTRALLQGQSFKHLLFRETAVMTQKGAEYEYELSGAEIWELTSDLILPPLDPSTPLLDGKGNPYPGNDSQGCMFNERGPFGVRVIPQVNRYSRSAIDSTEAFDLALTHERFGSKPMPDTRFLIASPKFYRFCRDHGLALDWVPVHIVV